MNLRDRLLLGLHYALWMPLVFTGGILMAAGSSLVWLGDLIHDCTISWDRRKVT